MMSEGNDMWHNSRSNNNNNGSSSNSNNNNNDVAGDTNRQFITTNGGQQPHHGGVPPMHHMQMMNEQQPPIYMNHDYMQHYHLPQQQSLSQPSQQQQHQQPQHPLCQDGQPKNALDNFTVLPIGQGSFIKVYHNNDDTMNFNNYELFSAPLRNTTAELGSATNINQQLHLPQQQQQQQQNAQVAMIMQQHQQQHSAAPPPFRNMHDANPSSLIQQLVGNWVPNISGTYSPFGEVSGPSVNQAPPPMLPHQQQHHDASLLTDDFDAGLMHQSNDYILQSNVFCDATAASRDMSPSINDIQSFEHTNGNFRNDENDNTANFKQQELLHNQQPQQQPASVSQPQPQQSQTSVQQQVKKPRIVAEVKPMRMSYSDVLSKNVFINKQDPAYMANNGNNINNASASSNATQSAKQSKVGGSGTLQHLKKHDEKRKSSSKNLLGDKENKDSNRQTDGEKSQQQNFDVIQNGGNKCSETSSNGGDNKGSNNEDSDKNGNRKLKQTNGGKVNNTAGVAKKASDKIKNPSTSATTGQANTSSSVNGGNDKAKKDSEKTYDFYNVAKADAEKPGSKVLASSAVNNKRRSRDINKKAPSNANSVSQQATQQPMSRKREKQSRTKAIKTGWHLWFERVVEMLGRVFLWLTNLIADVVILSSGILWDRICFGYDYCRSNIVRVIKDWRQRQQQNQHRLFNGQKIMAYLRKVFHWFWRRSKNPTATDGADNGNPGGSGFYKNGRLPQSGEEAMCALLTCKTKDAYSILGVAADCQQELIRKHYKKIAVLVHPDKNKQPGAEEAFKILRRAFELIGEPDLRAAYDQQLLETRAAEKTWSELNDLLAQLQTKIQEAANTIRCSSCQQRHPRRPTVRPHFAARECASCRIRHAAREGDIWAETTWFGMRWRYLALMEGKVYDITEWANCQRGALSHLQPNAHVVQYRIVLGGAGGNNSQQQHQNQEREKAKGHPEPSLDDFLDNLYSRQNPQQQASTMSSANAPGNASNFSTSASSSRRRARKN